MNDRHYDSLGVTRDASAADIKAAFRRLALRWHPDKGGDVERFKQLHAAWNVLNNIHKRAEYNSKLLRHESTDGLVRAADSGAPAVGPLFSRAESDNSHLRGNSISSRHSRGDPAREVFSGMSHKGFSPGEEIKRRSKERTSS